MKTKKQEELISLFISSLSAFGDEIGPLYREIIMYLSETGYNPHKQRSYIVFKHDLHNKQIAKTGIRINKDKSPFFALRFSACKNYSQRFADIVCAIVSENSSSEANCLSGGCDYCAGEPDTHVYKYTFPDATTKSHCGAVALEIPDITADDIGEIKRLIKENHEYLLKNQAGIGGA